MIASPAPGGAVDGDASGDGLVVPPVGLALGLGDSLGDGLGEAEGLVSGDAFAVPVVLVVQPAAKSKRAAKATPIRLPPLI